MSQSPPPSDDGYVDTVWPSDYGHLDTVWVVIFYVSIVCFFGLFVYLYCLIGCRIRREQINNDIEQGSSQIGNGPRNRASRNAGGGKAARQPEKEQAAFREVSWSVFVREKVCRETTDCCICLEDFSDEDRCKFRPNCKHIYHKSCIDQWLAREANCPLCRGTVCPSAPP